MWLAIGLCNRKTELCNHLGREGVKWGRKVMEESGAREEWGRETAVGGTSGGDSACRILSSLMTISLLFYFLSLD